jgi:hypothetical protein
LVEFDKATSKSSLSKIKDISKIEKLEENKWKLYSNKKEDLRIEISKFANDNGLLVLAMQKETQSLENVFKNLTLA